MYRTLSIAVLAAGAAAQSLNVSSQCKQAITGIVANPDASACLNPTALIGLVGDNNSSVIGPVNNWLTGVCANAPCSNATLASIVGNVTQGCSTELMLVGISSSDNAAIIQQVQTYYPTVRKIACLKDGDQICLTKLMGDLQNEYGTLSVNNIPAVIAKAGASPMSTPKNVTCSNCVKAAYGVLETDFPGVMSPSYFNETCGAEFVDGQTPVGISQTANTAAPGSGNEGPKNSASNVVVTGGAMFALVFGAFVSLF